ncbi:ankyrin repeat-containing domain protein [Aspergillus fruticulosus]
MGCLQGKFRKCLSLGADPITHNAAWRCPLSWKRHGFDYWDLESSPLILAATQGHTDVAGTLLAAGADINEVDHYSQTALIIASKEGNERLVGILLSDDRVDVSCRNPDGDALFVACEKGYQNIVRMMLSCGKDGVNVNTSGMESSYRALTIAVWGNYEPIVRMLLDAGATVNSPWGFRGAHFSTLLRVGVIRC